MQDNMWIFPNGLCISRAVLSTIIFRHVTAAPSRQQHFGQGNFSTHDGSVESDRVKLKSGRPNLASFLHVAFDWLQLLVSVLILNQCVRLSHSVNAEIMYVSIRNGRFVPYDLNRVRLELLFLGLEMFKTQFKTHWYVLVFCWIACWSVWLLLPLFVSPPLPPPDLERGLDNDDPTRCHGTDSAAIDVDMICTDWVWRELGWPLGGAARKISSSTNPLFQRHFPTAFPSC